MKMAELWNGYVAGTYLQAPGTSQIDIISLIDQQQLSDRHRFLCRLKKVEEAGLRRRSIPSSRAHNLKDGHMSLYDERVGFSGVSQRFKMSSCGFKKAGLWQLSGSAILGWFQVPKAVYKMIQ
ncbi:hypothetical protein KI387_026593, partial [Taxus chinensis]